MPSAATGAVEVTAVRAPGAVDRVVRAASDGKVAATEGLMVSDEVRVARAGSGTEARTAVRGSATTGTETASPGSNGYPWPTRSQNSRS